MIKTHLKSELSVENFDWHVPIIFKYTSEFYRKRGSWAVKEGNRRVSEEVWIRNNQSQSFYKHQSFWCITETSIETFHFLWHHKILEKDRLKSNHFWYKALPDSWYSEFFSLVMSIFDERCVPCGINGLSYPTEILTICMLRQKTCVKIFPPIEILLCLNICVAIGQSLVLF